MQSRIISIAIASTFLVGVAAWFGARYWTFGQFSSIFILVGSVLAFTLAVIVVGGDVFYRWLSVAISAGLAYRSFAFFFYLNSKGTPGEAYLLPGAAFSVYSVALFALLLFSHRQDQETIMKSPQSHP